MADHRIASETVAVGTSPSPLHDADDHGYLTLYLRAPSGLTNAVSIGGSDVTTGGYTMPAGDRLGPIEVPPGHVVHAVAAASASLEVLTVEG